MATAFALDGPVVPGDTLEYPHGKDSPVPTANPTLVTIVCESADYRCDEGLLQLDLVRSGRPVPVAGDAASRNPGPATSAQRVAA